HRAASATGQGWLGLSRQALLSVSIVLVVAAIGGGALGASDGQGRAPHASAPAFSKNAATFSLAWVGDMTFGTLNDWPAAGTGSLVAAMKPYLHSDLTVGNLETALGDLPLSKCT